jgi:hypothetical protein
MPDEPRQNHPSAIDKEHGLLKSPLPLLNDPEGDYLPDSLPFVVDAQ